MIELMVVIVIIIIVAGLVVVGITSALSSTRDSATDTRLQMLDGFMAAYANAENARTGGVGNTDAKRLPEAVRVGSPNETPTPPPEYYSTVDNGADPSAPPTTTRAPLTSPLPNHPFAYGQPPYVSGSGDATRYPAPFNQDNWILEPAVARTQAVMRILLRVPENQSTFASLPSEALTGAVPMRYEGADALLRSGPEPDPNIPDPNRPRPLDPPLMVDGHNNVIIYVPPTGLTDLAFKDGSMNVTVRAANGRAFWASAGPDGIFGFGRGAGQDGTYGTADDEIVPGADDNVYSTPVIRVTP